MFGKFKQYKVILLIIFIFSVAINYKAIVFNSPRTVSLSSGQSAIASGDLNGDGIPDLVTGGNPLAPQIFIGKIFVLLGKGNGSFYAPQSYSVGYNSNDPNTAPYVIQIQIADMNNDGRQDVVVGHTGYPGLGNQSYTYATVLFGDGSGHLQEAEGYMFFDLGTPQNLQSITLADVNNDNLLDIIAVINVGSSFARFHILKNLGNGSFQSIGRKIIGTNLFSLAVTKINDDAYPDFIMTSRLGVIITYGTELVFPTDDFEQRDENVFETLLLVRDFNSDGRIDFAVTPFASSQVRLFFQGQSGFPQSPVNYQTDEIINSLDEVDFNKDGKHDLMINTQGTFRVAYGNGLGSFQPFEIIYENQATWIGVYDDFDLNGKIDIGVTLPTGVGVLLNAPNPSRYYTDFNGDAKSDLTIYRPSTGTWWTLQSNTGNYSTARFGLPSDKPVAGNYDGDNKADIAVYRDGTWYILQSSDGIVRIENWGLGEDIPVQADYDNDGRMNLAVYRPSTGTWHIKNDQDHFAVRWGISTDKPVTGDYDGDGSADIAVYRPEEGNWYILRSSGWNYSVLNFGLAEDKPVAADYDGDGLADIAVYRPSAGIWYIFQSSSGNVRYERFGLPNDIPTPIDFDGDSMSDIAVFRQADGIWHILNSSTRQYTPIKWGVNGDLPIKVAN